LNVTGETSRIVLPSATGFAARQTIAILRRRDVPIASLLSRAGVSESDIDDPQHRIGAMAQGKLLEYAAETLRDSEFGLHLAQKAAWPIFNAAGQLKSLQENDRSFVLSTEQLKREHDCKFWDENDQ
jgi:Arabinose-binding domain of AraC transcription regulator, N-term